MKPTRLWIGALWLGWILCFVLLLALWTVTLSSRALSILNSRQVAMTANLEALRESFASLESLPKAVITTLREEAERGELTPQRIEQLEAEITPLAKLHWLDHDGSSASTTDPPKWLVSLLRSRLSQAKGIVTVRPLPPGMEAGRAGAQAVHEDTPESYLLVGAQLESGQYLACEMDLETVFGIWLRRPLNRSGLAESVSAKVLSEYAPWEPELTPPASVDPHRFLWPWQTSKTDGIWIWQVPTFFPNAAHPFPKLEVQLDNRAALEKNFARHLLGLLAGVILMLAFALSIHLTARAIGKEAQFTEARSRFQAMVSHELRTPISAIDMYLDILREGLVEDPEKLASYHQILKQESNRLRSLVENLLAAGALEHGEELTKEKLDFLALLQEVARSQTAEVETTFEPGPLEVWGNREALYGIFSNLIQNALKYGDQEHPPQLSAKTQGRQIVVEVADRGPGIAAAERTKIFEPYYRIERADTGKTPGVGLGLALVKGLVERHQGQIQVEDREGGGTIFKVTLKGGQ